MTNITAGGVSLPFFLVEGQRTNLFTREVGADVGGATTFNGSQVLFTEDSSSGQHAHKTPHMLTASTLYTVRVRISRTNGGRNAACYYDDGGVNRFGVYVDLSTGRLSDFLIGSGNLVSKSSIYVNGAWEVTFSGSLSSIVVESGVVLSLRLTSGESLTYIGDGQSSVLFDRVQSEAGANPSSYIATAGAAAQRNGDELRVTFPTEISNAQGELVELFAPYLWATTYPEVGPIELVVQTSGFPRLKASGPGVNSIEIQMKDNGGVTRLSGSSGTLPNASGKIGIVTGLWTSGGYINDSWNGVLGSQAGPYSTPWTFDGDKKTFNIGSVAAGRSPFSAVATMYVPGGLTATERTVLNQYFGGRTITFAS
jgi:hypothetical protein